MMLETTPWNPADHLDSEEMILAYLEAVFEEGDPELVALALNNIARARGRHPALDLSPGADIGALIRAMKSLGLELTAKAA
ncbi:DNA-binding protein [Sphingomonas qilianensis]|uniref:Transcriptional regulator n=1 Tax=Sphingomonas qilianensis TaxID=1736690 RepID=A0ABU9XU94_9SPHN